MSKVGAIILAAGMSKRMGKPKLLLPLKGAPLIYYPISLALRNQLIPVGVIAGQYMNEIQKEMNELTNITYIYNPQFESGMASSLKLGIQAVDKQVDAVMIFLGDQPFVPDVVIEALLKEYELNKENGVHIIRPCYDGELGHPILFDKRLFNEFDEITGDEGGRSIIKANKDRLKIIDFPNRQWGLDIDTPEEYEMLWE